MKHRQTTYCTKNKLTLIVVISLFLSFFSFNVSVGNHQPVKSTPQTELVDKKNEKKVFSLIHFVKLSYSVLPFHLDHDQQINNIFYHNNLNKTILNVVTKQLLSTNILVPRSYTRKIPDKPDKDSFSTHV